MQSSAQATARTSAKKASTTLVHRFPRQRCCRRFSLQRPRPVYAEENQQATNLRGENHDTRTLNNAQGLLATLANNESGMVGAFRYA
jgi:hypothetical protein